MVGALGDVDEKISDRTLILTLLRNVNENFFVYHSIVPLQQPFPSFLQTRSLLVLHEQGIPTAANNNSTSTSTNNSSCDYSNSRNRRKHNNGDGSGGSSGNGSNTSSGRNGSNGSD